MALWQYSGFVPSGMMNAMAMSINDTVNPMLK
jgi:hypothetical protein